MTDRLPSVTMCADQGPPAKVWAALTQPPTLSVVADVRPGGRFSVVFRLLNGDEHNPTGVYREVTPPEKLVLTWDLPGAPEPESLVTFRLEPFDGETELTLTHERLPDEAAGASHEHG